MNDSDDPRSLAATNATLQAQIRDLTAELAETNQGVMALYAELDDKAAQLRHASELKSRFLSYVSHEFRTPLGSVRSLARLLLDRLDGPLAPEQEKQVKLIQSAAIELSEMVDDLLDLAKVEAGRLTVSPGWFDMVDLFTTLRGMFRPLLTNPLLQLVFEDPVDVPRIYTDDRKLAQILRNLIANAMKFTERGEVRVRAVRDSEYVKFSVADTGIGIAADDLARLFEDYTQLDSPVHRRYRGTGLGLSLSRKFAVLLGGDITVDSVVGRGSNFYVTIPLRCPSGEDPAQARHV